MAISNLAPNWTISELNRKFTTDEAISEEQNNAFSLSRKLTTAGAIGSIAGFVICAIASGLVFFWPDLKHFSPLTVFAGSGAIQLIAGFFMLFAGAIVCEKGELLTPLASSDYCIETNDLVNRYAIARMIRDEILQQGRQLYVMDYVTLATAARSSELDDESELKRAACANLHKLNSDA